MYNPLYNYTWHIRMWNNKCKPHYPIPSVNVKTSFVPASTQGSPFNRRISTPIFFQPFSAFNLARIEARQPIYFQKTENRNTALKTPHLHRYLSLRLSGIQITYEPSPILCFESFPFILCSALNFTQQLSANP